MKRLCSLFLFLFACQGPMGPAGPMGEMGKMGADGATIDHILNLTERVAEYEPSVLVLWCYPVTDTKTSAQTCTGTKIGDHEFLTAFHCINGVTRCDIEGPDGTLFAQWEPTATSWRHSLVNAKPQDEATLYVNYTPDGQRLENVPYDADYHAEQGELMMSVGYPSGFLNKPVYTFGRVAVASANQGYDRQDTIVMDLVIWHGNSGGPLFNYDNLLVGVAVSGYDKDNYDLNTFNALRDIWGKDVPNVSRN